MTEESKGRLAALALVTALIGQAILLSFIRSGTSYDGAEQLLYTQYLDWGYGRSQPPLFTWLLAAAHQVFGVTQLAENLLKFGLLAAGFLAVRHVSLRLGYGVRIATATMLSVFLVVEIGWEAQRNYTHTVLLFALMGGVAVAYLSLLREVSRGRFAVLGVLAGAVILAKYNGGLAILALILADVVTPWARVFFRKESAWFWIVAALSVAPHGVWALSNRASVFAMSRNFVDADQGGVG